MRLTVVDDAALELERHDLSAVADPDERERAALAWAAELSKRPFALQVGPLVRAGLARLGPDEHLFVLGVHHMVCDAWSMELL